MTSNKIKLEVSPKTVYTDLVTLPSTLMLGLTIRWYNQTDSTLYFKFTISGTGWTSTTVTLGSLGGGSNKYSHLDNLTSRSKPSTETTDTLTCTLKAYTDSGYTDLYTQFSRDVTVVMIKSDDGTWTQDVLNNFDDGTFQGWDVYLESGETVSKSLVTDYVLSSPYSIRMRQSITGTTPQLTSRLYKSFTTPNKTTIYAIINVRATRSANYVKNITIKRDTTTLALIGRPFDTEALDYHPLNKWLRIVVPLPANTTLEVRIVHENTGAYSAPATYDLWLDDFKIISRN